MVQPDPEMIDTAALDAESTTAGAATWYAACDDTTYHAASWIGPNRTSRGAAEADVEEHRRSFGCPSAAVVS
jgi:hypothetical protein